MAGDDERTATSLESPSGHRRLCLLVVHETLAATYPLPPRGTVVIGRSREADLRLDLAPISRRHVTLHIEDTIKLEDLGSSNGTRIREQPVEPGTTVIVAPGDAIELGSVLLVIQWVATATGPATRSPLDRSDTMRTLDKLVARVAVGDINVLLHGETGAGKEGFAERLHGESARAGKPLLRLNCAALTESLLESELFGYERGAFTGATQSKPGLLETADGGTVFLDEIGDLPLGLQAKLLRVIEDRKVLRLGALKPRAIDVRFVAATHKDLEAESERGGFRQDLYFRIAGVTIVIPPLRERLDELDGLVRLFARGACERAKRAPIGITRAALAQLRAHPWPGNIRELRNVIERAVLLADTEIDVEHLPAARTTPAPADLRAGVVAYERQRIVDALAACSGNQTKAAKVLGISRRTLIERLDEMALPRPRKR